MKYSSLVRNETDSENCASRYVHGHTRVLHLLTLPVATPYQVSLKPMMGSHDAWENWLANTSVPLFRSSHCLPTPVDCLVSQALFPSNCFFHFRQQFRLNLSAAPRTAAAYTRFLYIGRYSFEAQLDLF